MNSSVPYLVKAIKEWIQDNGLTPYLVINAEENDVEVPIESVQNGKMAPKGAEVAQDDFQDSSR